jgi:nitrite reductase/ring-hydroxylating ferredoxin subunit
LPRPLRGNEPEVETVQETVLKIPRPARDALDGVWLGAPLHPALTDVPLGSWTAAAALDLVGSDAADDVLLIGVLAALPTALTGLNDWSHLKAEPRRLGVIHALVNSTGLCLNVGSLLLRRRGRRGLARALSGLAYLGTLYSAHLGGQLSFGLGVRVNRTAFEDEQEEWTPVADEEDVGTELRRVGGALVTRSAGGAICAIAATCSHLGGPLDEGEREGDTVVCPWHGSRFDLCTGAVEGGPAVFPQPRYETRVRDGKVEIRAARDV